MASQTNYLDDILKDEGQEQVKDTHVTKQAYIEQEREKTNMFNFMKHMCPTVYANFRQGTRPDSKIKEEVIVEEEP